MSKFKVTLNSTTKIEELLQETYMAADQSINFITNEINKLINSTKLKEMTMDEKAKYAKSLHDYNIDKEKAIRCKLDLGKLLHEIVKHGGSIEEGIKSKTNDNVTTLNIKALRDLVNSGDTTTPKIIEINK